MDINALETRLNKDRVMLDPQDRDDLKLLREEVQDFARAMEAGKGRERDNPAHVLHGPDRRSEKGDRRGPVSRRGGHGRPLWAEPIVHYRAPGNRRREDLGEHGAHRREGPKREYRSTYPPLPVTTAGTTPSKRLPAAHCPGPCALAGHVSLAEQTPPHSLELGVLSEIGARARVSGHYRGPSASRCPRGRATLPPTGGNFMQPCAMFCCNVGRAWKRIFPGLASRCRTTR